MAIRFLQSPTGDFLAPPGAPTSFLARVVADVDPEPVPPPSLPTIAISAASTPPTAIEGTHASVTFAVTLSVAHSADVSYTVATANGTALAALDYTAVSATRTITAGNTSDTVTVVILDNDSYRASRSFTVRLANAVSQGLSLVVTNGTGTCVITDDDAPVVSGSPYGDGVHPRIWIVPDAYGSVAGPGTVSEIRSRINTYHATAYQSTIDAINGRLATAMPSTNSTASRDVVEKTHAWDAYGASLLALLDPDTMNADRIAGGRPIYRFNTRTVTDYLQAAKTRVLDGIVERHYRHWNGSIGWQNQEETPEKYPLSVIAAAVFSNAMATPGGAAVWTEADRKRLLQGAIFAVAKRTIKSSEKDFMSEQAQKGLMRGSMVAFAMKGETGNWGSEVWPSLPGLDGATSGSALVGVTNTTGETYDEAIDRMVAQQQADYLRFLNAAETWFEGKGGWAEGYQYSLQVAASLGMALTAMATALGRNYFDEFGWLRTYPLYFLSTNAPMVYTAGHTRTHGVMIKEGNASYEYPPVVSTVRHFMAFLRDASPAAAQSLAHWHRTRGSSYSTNPVTGYIHDRYLFGYEHEPYAAPETFSEFATGQQWGLRVYASKTSNAWQDGVASLYMTATREWLQGHHARLWGALEWHRFGHLLLQGGTSKSFNLPDGTSGGMFNDHGKPAFHSCAFRIYRTDETPSTPDNEGYPTANTLRWADPAGATLQARHAYCANDNTSCYLVTSASDLDGLGYHYVTYNYGGVWAAGASYVLREVIHLLPVNGGEPYLLVWDRATVNDPEIDIPFQTWRVPTLPTMTGRTLLEGPGSHTAADSGNPDSEGESGVWSSTARTWSMTNTLQGAHGRLFAYTLLPSTIDLRLVGGDYGYCSRDYTPVSLGGCRVVAAEVPTVQRGAQGAITGSRSYMRDAVARWSGRYRVETRNGAASPGAEQQFATLFQASDSRLHTSMSPVTPLTSTGGEMTGASIADPARTRVVLRAAAHTARVTGSFSYTVSGLSGLAHHTLVGIDTSEPYQVTRVGTTFTVTPGSGPYTSTANGTLEVTL